MVGAVVVGAAVEKVYSSRQLTGFVEMASQRRTTGTSMHNASSSRTHAFLQLHLERTDATGSLVSSLRYKV